MSQKSKAPVKDGKQVKSIEKLSVGDVIQFAGYDWRVLDIQGCNALILSETVLEIRAYHGEYEPITWAQSDIRQYLNGEFYNSFNEQDRARIVEVAVTNNDNPWFVNDPRYDDEYDDGFHGYLPDMRPSGGIDTTDNIFLLSLEEVIRYFGDSGQLGNKPREEADQIEDQYDSLRIARDTSGGASWWWLRSPGYSSKCAVRVHCSGAVDMISKDVSLDSGGIRPALLLNLK